MQSTSQFSLVQSGYPFSVQNAVAIASGGTLTVAYTVSGSPSALSIVVQGIKNASGNSVVLDTYVGTSGTTRTISLNDTYDSFTVTATWTDPTNKTSIAVSMTAAGPGQTQTAVVPLLPLSGVGSPQNVVSAPIGTTYSNITGIAGSTYWVKTSGSGSSGWTNVA